ncbi:MAG: enoyl-CoA hydratase/isomerase family protein [Deltaproteobacteria bacterium]|nr:enoyl-CoA hydratase/isomerase family protein [Deltaproteobacteria bacterium]
MEFIRSRVEERVGIIEFYNPPANFMTAAMVRELDDLTRRWAKDPEVRAVILTSGIEGLFISHYEIKDILEMFVPLQRVPAGLRRLNTLTCRLSGGLLRLLDRCRPELGAWLEKKLLQTQLSGVVELECIHRVFRRLETMPKVTIAALNGEAMGGATELSLACDFRLMADGDYRFGLPEATVAIIPGAGGTQRLTRLLGFGRALELMLEGTMLTPRQALEYGLLHRVLPADELLPAALELARKMARRPPCSVGGIKRAVRIGGSLPLPRGLEVEKAAFFACGYIRDPVNAFEYYLAESEKGRSDRKILTELATGKPVEFTGR